MKRKLVTSACFLAVGWAAMFGAAEAKEVDWAALNPAFAKAPKVGRPPGRSAR